MKNLKWAVAILCATTAMQTQARNMEEASPIPIAAIDPKDVNANVDRAEDILRVCTVNRGGSVFGRNATPGVIEPANIRGLKSEYSGRYNTVLQTPDGLFLTVDQLQRIEALPGPNVLTCDGKTVTLTMDETTSIDLLSPQAVGGTLAPSQDPDLAVQPLPPEVKSGRYLPRPADIRGELDGIVAQCRTASEEDGPALRARYERFFGQLRELRAVRDDLRERLLSNDPTLDEEDALNQLKKLDPAVDGAVFPSQLKCPPASGEPISQTSYDPELAKDVLIAASGELDEPTYPDALFDEDGEYIGPPRDRPESQPLGGPIVKDKLWFFTNFSLGQTDFDTPQTGIGFQSTGPGTETFAATVPSRVDSFTAAAGLSYQPSGSDLTYTFYGRYSEGDARTDFDIPAGGPIDVGNVYGGRSPSDSTGLNIGNRGLTGFNSSAQKIYEAKVSISKPLNADDDFAVIGSLFFNTIIIDRDYNSQSRASVFGTTITQQRDQEVSDHLYGLGGILSGRIRIADGVDLTGSVAGGIYYRDSDMESEEVNDCALCPAADQNFTLNFDESDSGVAFAGTVSAGFEFDIKPNLKILLGADASYLSDVGQVINPSSGDQVLAGETTRLGLTDAWRWQATAGLKLSFR